MYWRPWMVASALIAGAILNLGLRHFEEIRRTEQPRGPGVTLGDPHAGMAFAIDQRQPNFRSFGLRMPLLEQASQMARDLHQRHGDHFKRLLNENQEVAALAFCGSAGLPQRYTALQVLVRDDEGSRSTIDLTRRTSIEVQEWYRPAQIHQVYEALELVEGRREDGTVMVIGAILTGRERDAMAGQSPWGRGLIGRWSFDALLNQHSLLGEDIVKYLAAMHVGVELARSERICTRGAD